MTGLCSPLEGRLSVSTTSELRNIWLAHNEVVISSSFSCGIVMVMLVVLRLILSHVIT